MPVVRMSTGPGNTMSEIPDGVLPPFRLRVYDCQTRTTDDGAVLTDRVCGSSREVRSGKPGRRGGVEMLALASLSPEGIPGVLTYKEEK